MPVAYVLLNTEIGAEREVLTELRNVEGVEEAFNLVGIYDIIARVKADNINLLNQIVSQGLQMSKVHSKMTIILTEPPVTQMTQNNNQ